MNRHLKEIRDRIDHLRKVDANVVDPGTYQTALLVVLSLLADELERVDKLAARSARAHGFDPTAP